MSTTVGLSDRCPYRRPFGADFAACPAFEVVVFVPLDTRHQALPAVLSCHHLHSREHRPSRAFYPACALGTAADRVAYARRRRPGWKAGGPAQPPPGAC